MINTNEIKVEFNKKSIDRDFDIFKIYNEEKNIFYKCNVLDIAKEELNAVSVVYTWGQTCYAMFKKGSVDIDKLKEIIKNENINMQVEKIELLSEAIYNNVLTMLILNSLNLIKTDGRYNNLTGKLYLMNDSLIDKDKNKKVKSFHAIEVKLNSCMELKLSVATFGRFDYFSKYKKMASKRKYVFDKETYEIRRKLKTDNVENKEMFIQKSIDHNEHTFVPFLDYRGLKEFKKCKMGMMDELFCDVEEYLGDYIKIENSKIEEYYTHEGNSESFENTDYSYMLKDKKIIIIDEVKNSDSKKLLSLLMDNLYEKYNIRIEEKDEIEPGEYNIRIIHNAAYYEENHLEDPHESISDKNVIQHITLESFKDDKKNRNIEEEINNAVKKIIQELIIKEDIIKKKISIVNWEKYNYKDKWTFLKRKQIQVDEKKYKYIYCEMIISRDGTFQANIFDSSNISDDNWEWNAIRDAFGNEYGYRKEDNIEGIFYKDYENINKIIKTDKTTVPNFKELGRLLRTSDKNKKIPVSSILSSLENFVHDDKKVMDKKEEFVSELKRLPEYATINEINRLLNVRTKGGKVINKYILNELGILINPRLKQKDRKYELFNSMLDIKYYSKGKEIYYFVGVDSKKINQSIKNACAIRKVVADDKNEFENIVNLLSVEFVRNGQYTVTPFPFKYINEIFK